MSSPRPMAPELPMVARTLLGLLALGGLAAGAAGCDTITGAVDGDNGDDGPATSCLYNYEASTVASDFGEACSVDDDCNHGVCLQPGEQGNVTNAVFGFCTRGCDCDDSTDAGVSGADGTYSCVYPGSCFAGQSQGAWRYVVPKCSSIDDCTAIDSRYNKCTPTGSETVTDTSCGQLHSVCQAH